ncbi:MAG TPA: hypothetical protein VGC54_01260 [Planctomycetota bacterium]
MTRTTILGILIPLLLPVLRAPAAAQQPLVATSDAAWVAADDLSGGASVSRSGRFMVFESKASNLVPGDTNGDFDVFVKDFVTGAVERVSVSSAGVEGDDVSRFPGISQDGRWVAFYSFATNLDPADTNAEWDVYVHDRTTGTTELVSYATDGTVPGTAADGTRAAVSNGGARVAFASLYELDPKQLAFSFNVYTRDRISGTTDYVDITLGGTAAGHSTRPSLSADGSKIVFESNVDLVVEDINSHLDVYTYDFASDVFKLISFTPAGFSGVRNSKNARITPDGAFISFESEADDLDVRDANGFKSDVFLWSEAAGTVEIVSLSTTGSASPSTGSDQAQVSADGRYVIFFSRAPELHPCSPLAAAYLRDTVDETLEIASIPAYWDGILGDGTAPFVGEFGRVTGWRTYTTAGFYEPYQVLVRRMGGSGSVILTGKTYAISGGTYTASWCGAPAGSSWILYRSGGLGGSIIAGARFDLGPAVRLVASGTNDAFGAGSFAGTVPVGAVGRTIYIEVRCDSGGSIYDSNPLEVEVF